MLGRIQNGLEVSNEDYSQSRCPILVCLITLAVAASRSRGLRKARQTIKKACRHPSVPLAARSSRAKAPRAHPHALAAAGIDSLALYVTR